MWKEFVLSCRVCVLFALNLYVINLLLVPPLDFDPHLVIWFIPVSRIRNEKHLVFIHPSIQVPGFHFGPSETSALKTFLTLSRFLRRDALSYLPILNPPSHLLHFPRSFSVLPSSTLQAHAPSTHKDNRCPHQGRRSAPQPRYQLISAKNAPEHD